MAEGKEVVVTAAGRVEVVKVVEREAAVMVEVMVWVMATAATVEVAKAVAKVGV